LPVNAVPAASYTTPGDTIAERSMTLLHAVIDDGSDEEEADSF
jgi:hypothetical protein